ncbi:hypothetical protein F4814DRAFT_459961 [Daldinia grandis]|nr:hypothetical protein F4814DRAFT_459961 [Daldinia grandis]
MSEFPDEDVSGLAGQPSNKAVKKAKIKPRSKPTARQATRATKNVARRLFEPASSPEDNTENRVDRPAGEDRLVSGLENLTKAVTELISVVKATRSIAGTSSVPQLRREDIGQFNPGYPDPRDSGMLNNGHTQVFTDVDRFIGRIEYFLEDRDTAAAHEKQILFLFELLLDGPAAMWWSVELAHTARRSLRKAGLSKMLDALRRRFPYNRTITLTKYFEGLDLREIERDENRLTQFLQAKLRQAKSFNFLDKDNGNWHSILERYWCPMDKNIFEIIPPPSDEYSLEEYMSIVYAEKWTLSRVRDMY